MKPWFLVATVTILAVIPLTEGPMAVADLLRAAAIQAGCRAPVGYDEVVQSPQEPAVSMRWNGTRTVLEIEVRCEVPEP